jgi:heptosyltransferase III
MKNIILSRTDSLGDVILTLPLAGVLKNHFPGCRIIFLGKTYTQPVIEACSHVDLFVNWDAISAIKDRKKRIQSLKDLNAEAIIHAFPVKAVCRLAKEAGIPIRISTSHRWFSWLYCNKLVHFSRRRSDLHEAQLNLKLLEPLGIKEEIPITKIPDYFGLTKIGNDLPQFLSTLISSDKFNLILHPKSKGSAREWGIENFTRLIGLLPQNKFRIFITGTKEEGQSMKDFLSGNKERIIDLTGKLTLPELLVFIDRCDGLVAASTGPLHIAAAFGKRAIGLYAPMRPIFPARWAPLGKNADYLVLEKSCIKCRNTNDCECIRDISPEEIAGKLIIER